MKRNGLQEYDRIRSYISNIYLYGFLSREEFVELGINGPDEYDSCVKLLKTVLPFIHDDAAWEGGKKRLRINRTYEAGNERRLTNTYLLHTISDEEAVELLLLLSHLSEKPKSKNELRRDIELNGVEISESTLNRRLAELKKYGYLCPEGKRSGLSGDVLATLGDEQLLALWNYVCFSCEVTYPRVAGSFLRRSILREADRRGLKLPEEFPFLLRHNDCRNLFDEDMAYRLSEAIRQRRAVTAHVCGVERSILPMSMRIDTLLGRWYLMYWDEQPRMVRLSDITHMKAGKTVDAGLWQSKYDQVLRRYQHSGCSARAESPEPAHVRAELRFGDQEGLYRQFCREIRKGGIIRENGKMYYDVRINDPGELIPFLRQYSPWLRILPGEHCLDQRIRSDLERMRSQTEAAL